MKKTNKLQEKKESNKGKMAFKLFDGKAYKELDGEKHVIEIKFASYGNIDSDGDVLVRGCFGKSISERGPESVTNRKIAFLWQHDMKDPIGKILCIEEREDGAYATVRLSSFDAVPNAKRAWYQLNDGDINQFSFGFEYVWDKVEYDENVDGFIVREVKLFEVSVVTLGANELTAYVGEGKDEKELEDYLKELSTSNKDRFNEIKQMILKLGAEPEHKEELPLTSEEREDSLFEKLSKLN